MESVYAALLLHKAKKEINESSLEKVLKAAGVDADKNQLKALVAGLEGKKIDDLIAGAAMPMAAAPAAPAAEEKGGKKKDDKKEEKKKEEEPSGIGALFG
jgi:large subunit ribosomal protein L12